MALTKCPECGGQVSTNAAACPHCGSPIRQAPTEREAKVKRGGRTLKGIGFALLAIGVIVGPAGMQEGSQGAAMLGGLMAFTGFVLFIVGRFQD